MCLGVCVGGVCVCLGVCVCVCVGGVMCVCGGVCVCERSNSHKCICVGLCDLQLLGITVRADIPLGLDLMTVAWRTLVGMTPDAGSDLQEADPMTYTYLKKIEMVWYFIQQIT